MFEVLLVEVDPDARRVPASILGRAGFAVALAANRVWGARTGR